MQERDRTAGAAEEHKQLTWALLFMVREQRGTTQYTPLTQMGEGNKWRKPNNQPRELFREQSHCCKIIFCYSIEETTVEPSISSTGFPQWMVG